MPLSLIKYSSAHAFSHDTIYSTYSLASLWEWDESSSILQANTQPVNTQLSSTERALVSHSNSHCSVHLDGEDHRHIWKNRQRILGFHLWDVMFITSSMDNKISMELLQCTIKCHFVLNHTHCHCLLGCNWAVTNHVYNHQKTLLLLQIYTVFSTCIGISLVPRLLPAFPFYSYACEYHIALLWSPQKFPVILYAFCTK